MPQPTIVIVENDSTSCRVVAKDVRDRQHIQRLLLEALFPFTEEGAVEVDSPEEKLTLLRNFIDSLGVKDIPSTQRLLIMCLFQIADELEGKRLVIPSSLTKVLQRK